MFYLMRSNVSQHFTNKLRENKVSLYDSWLTDQLPPAEETFFDVSQSPGYITDYNNQSGNFLVVSTINLDETKVSYQRNVITISYALSLTGGLMSLITSVLNFVLGSLERHLFITSLLGKIFLFSGRKHKQKQV